MSRYTKSSSAMTLTMTVSIFPLLQFLAESGVKAAHDKKQNDDSSEDQVAHRFSFGCSQKRE